MPAELSFTVMTPSGLLVQAQGVRKVRVRLISGGLLSIYPYHAPLIAETMTGQVLYVSGEREEHLWLDGGIFFVQENAVTLYTSGRVGDESKQAAPVSGDDRAERFDRLATVLMSRLRARPHRTPDDGATENSESS